MDDITIQIPANAVRLEAQHLVIPAHLGRYVIGELLRAFEAEEEPSNEPTYLAYSPVLGMVPVSIVACNRTACMVRGYVNGQQTGLVRVSKGDLFPRLGALEVPPGK